MKIIKTGKIPEPPIPWWVNKIITCDHCKTEYQLEKQDKVKEVVERRPNGGSLIEFACPLCIKTDQLLKGGRIRTNSY